MKIIFLGTGAFGVPALEALSHSSHTLLAVVSSAGKPQGRNLETKPSPVKIWALAHGVPVLDDLDALRPYTADLFVVISFGKILPKEILQMPKIAPLNVHASLLPRWRGAAPIQWALWSGDTRTGVSVIRMVEKLDAGDVLRQKETPIQPDEDRPMLEKRLSALGAKALMESIEVLAAGRAVFEPQPTELDGYARKIVKEDGRLLFNQEAHRVSNHVRAMKGWPGSYCIYKGKRLIVLGVGATRRVTPTRPGTILQASTTEGLWVAARDSSIEIKEIQLEGKKPLKTQEFLKGFPIKPGDVLE